MGKQSDKKQSKKLINVNTLFNIVEAYKVGRTNIQVLLENKGCQRILVTSPLAQEGKTITCANMAIAFAQTGARVIILDCDFRKPSQDMVFNIDTKEGIVDVLEGTCKLQEAMYRTTYMNLDVIPVGTIPSNPSELIDSQEMVRLLDNLSAAYEYIFLDTPPVSIVTDAALLAKLASGVIMVVRRKKTRHKDVQQAINQLKFVGAPLLGTILNDKKSSKGKNSKYYRYGKTVKRGIESNVSPQVQLREVAEGEPH